MKFNFRTVKLQKAGYFTIPKEIRDKLGIELGDTFEWSIKDDEAYAHIKHTHTALPKQKILRRR